MKPDTVIFDLDGTLLDTLADLQASVNHALSLWGMPPRTTEEMRMFVGNGNPYMLHCAVPAGTDEATEKAVLDAFYAHYRVNYKRKTVPYPGIEAMLRRLKESGIRTGVCSNKFHEATVDLINDLLPGLIGFTLGTIDGVPRKPAPEMPERILRELGAEKETAVYVGDSDVDVKTAKAAGLRMLAVTWGFRTTEQLKAAGAAEFADSVEELERLLL